MYQEPTNPLFARMATTQSNTFAAAAKAGLAAPGVGSSPGRAWSGAGLVPPRIGVSLAAYKDYVAAFRLYVAAVSSGIPAADPAQVFAAPSSSSRPQQAQAAQAGPSRRTLRRRRQRRLRPRRRANSSPVRGRSPPAFVAEPAAVPRAPSKAPTVEVAESPLPPSSPAPREGSDLPAAVARSRRAFVEEESDPEDLLGMRNSVGSFMGYTAHSNTPFTFQDWVGRDTLSRLESKVYSPFPGATSISARALRDRSPLTREELDRVRESNRYKWSVAHRRNRADLEARGELSEGPKPRSRPNSRPPHPNPIIEAGREARRRRLAAEASGAASSSS